MLRFSKFKADSNKLVHRIFKHANIRCKFQLNNNPLKKNFCSKSTSKISERLSFLNTEEEMRKYFNIVDYDKKDADFFFNEELKKDQKIFIESQKEIDGFDRKKLLEYINKYKSELQSMNNEDEKKNYFEIINEYSLEREKVNLIYDYE